MSIRTKIIDVERKPSKCPVCGGAVVDIVYGTGDMTEIEFLFAYRKEAIMGGDNIPRRPPIWACSCCCKRFRKINPDGSDAPVKVKLLQNIRKGSLDKFTIETPSVETALNTNDYNAIHQYQVRIETEYGEKETINVSAVSPEDAEATVKMLVSSRQIGLRGTTCISIDVSPK
jgi:DNA polymerase II large subunit